VLILETRYSCFGCATKWTPSVSGPVRFLRKSYRKLRPGKDLEAIVIDRLEAGARR